MASSGNSNRLPAAVLGGSGTSGTPANNVGGSSTTGADGRRTSQGSGGGLFSGLMNQKRNSTDAIANARRQSFADQKPESGILGKMWNNFTTGSSPPK